MRTIWGVCFVMISAVIPAHATQVIALWDVVPGQEFTGTFKAGVVAFHETGVDVAFKVNGTDLTTVTDPTYNDRTRVYEYWVELDAADYTDGVITLDATCTPDGSGHMERVMSTLTLYANAGGSLDIRAPKWVDCVNGNDMSTTGSETDPYKTIQRAYQLAGSGNTIYLKKGTAYMAEGITKVYDRWTTITCAPGLTYKDVEVGSPSGLDADHIRCKDLTLYIAEDQVKGRIFGKDTGTWADGCSLFTKSDPGAEVNTPGCRYLTGSRLSVFKGQGGFGSLIRNTTLDWSVADVFPNPNGVLAVNLTVKKINREPYCPSCHSDFVQYGGNGMNQNNIWYNVKVLNAGAQGFFGEVGRDIAWVNVLYHNTVNISQYSRFDHVLLWHIASKQRWSNGDSLSHFDVRDCIFDQFRYGDVTELPSSVIDHNHYTSLALAQTNGGMGTSFEVGDPLYVDAANLDFRITDTSPAYGTGVPIPGCPADIDGVLYDETNPSKGCYAKDNDGTAGIFNIQYPVTSLQYPVGNRTRMYRMDGGEISLSRVRQPGMYLLYDGQNVSKMIVIK